jgi:peptide/nickel transport system permease protein
MTASQTLAFGAEADGPSLRGRAAKFALRRLASLVAILVVLTFLVFAMVQLIPGNPAAIALGVGATPKEIAAFSAAQGWNKPFFVQFADYVSKLLHGNLGSSFGQLNESVGREIATAIGPTAELAGAALVVSLVAGLVVGIVAGGLTYQGRRKKLDVGFGATISVLGSSPDFLTATILVFLFAVQIEIFPVGGDRGLISLVLPVLAVSLHPACTLARVIRAETRQVLQQDFIRTARAQRLPGRIIYGRYVLPNVLVAALSVGSLVFAYLIGGTIVIELIFNRPGLGTDLVNAVLAHQYEPVQGITLLVGSAVVIFNALVDVALMMIDPRRRKAQL